MEVSQNLFLKKKKKWKCLSNDAIMNEFLQ